MEEDFISGNTAVLKGRRFKHVIEILKAEKDSSIRAGLLNGMMGEAIVKEISTESVVLETDFNSDPPPGNDVMIVLAMPRPKVMKRVLRFLSSAGIKDIHIIKTWRSDKNYFSSPVLLDEKIRENLILGLEQGRDTVLPHVSIHKRFRPFAEDELPLLSAERFKITAHPYGERFSPNTRGVIPTVVLIGPEGGLIEWEVKFLEERGFKTLSFSDRILTVEDFLPYLLGKLIY